MRSMRTTGSATASATSSFNRHAHVRLAPRPRGSEADERGPTEEQAESSEGCSQVPRGGGVGARLRSSASPCGSRERAASLGRPAKSHARHSRYMATRRSRCPRGGRGRLCGARLADPDGGGRADHGGGNISRAPHRSHRRLPYTAVGGWTIASFKNPTKGRGLGTQLARSAV
jgi:hypothetical protein